MCLILNPYVLMKLNFANVLVHNQEAGQLT